MQNNLILGYQKRLSFEDRLDFLNSVKPVVLKIFNLSSSALFHNKLKIFEDPKLLVDLCQVKSDLKNIQFPRYSYLQNNSSFIKNFYMF